MRDSDTHTYRTVFVAFGPSLVYEELNEALVRLAGMILLLLSFFPAFAASRDSYPLPEPDLLKLMGLASGKVLGVPAFWKQ
jgi:hypothetical protein